MRTAAIRRDKTRQHVREHPPDRVGGLPVDVGLGAREEGQREEVAPRLGAARELVRQSNTRTRAELRGRVGRREEIWGISDR